MPLNPLSQSSGYWLPLACLLLLPTTLQAHTIPSRPGLSLNLDLAVYWRSDNQLTDQDRTNEVVWQIPGLLMGGHATRYEQGPNLDEATLRLDYLAEQQRYATLSLGSHGDDLSLDTALIGQGFDLFSQPAHLEVGKMDAFFSPGNHVHPSTDIFNHPALGHTALLGGQLKDSGLRASFGQENRGFSAGLESYKGSSFPAAGTGGLHAGFLRHAHQGFNLDWQLQAWYLTATAENRKDDRSADGHSHGSSNTSTAFTGSYDGDTQGSGLFAEIGWTFGHRQRFSLRGEGMRVKVEGQVQDESRVRQINLDGEYQSLNLEPRLQWGSHTLGLRYEHLSIRNRLTGAAAAQLGAEAGLINNQHNPERLTLAWHWQYSPALALRLEWLQDKAMPDHQPEVLAAGLVWTQVLL